ncbi:MAG: hypothetical protein ACOVNY_05750 [Chitinophagaceae bacterium]
MKYIILVFLLFIGIASCKKETSLEGIPLHLGNAQGTLLDAAGNCQDIIVAGHYGMDTALTDSNYVLVKVNFTVPGKYVIYTDSTNGFWFRDSTFIIKTGVHVIKLKGYGMPILPIIADYNVYFNNSSCHFQVDADPTKILIAPFNPPSATEFDYFPMSSGSNWTYNTQNGTQLDTLRVTTLANTRVVNGNTYRLFTTSLKDTALYRKDNNGKYYYYGKYGFGRIPNTETREFLFLDDKLNVGGSWETDLITGSDPVQGNFTYKIKFTIDAKNVSYNIDNIRFDSVIRVKEDITFTISNIPFTTTLYNYYAKKIGLVYFDFKAFVLAPYEQKLKRWSIN